MPINTDYRNTLSLFAASNNTNTKTKGTEDDTGKENSDDKVNDKDNTDKTGSNIDAVFGKAKDKNVSMEDFLALMVAQLKNQDFMNPVDDTQYVTQLAQISSMQQMEEMNYNAKSTYVASLVGKTVNAAKFTVTGELKKTEGVVEKVSLLDGEFVVYVKGESYDLDEIMEIKVEASGEKPPVDPPKEPGDDEDDGSGDGGGEVGGGDDEKT